MEDADHLARALQQNGYDSPSSLTDRSLAGGQDEIEFFGFLAWHVMLIICCVVPTACAYRRRMMQQQNPSQVGNHINSAVDIDGRAKTERVNAALEKTTMTVDAIHLTQRMGGETDDITISDEETGETAIFDQDVSTLQLLSDAPNGGRRVPAACAICLCSYVVNDAVTWSPRSQCQHAFHKDCIVTWLGKKEQPICPCCRQDFLNAPNPAITTLHAEAERESGVALDEMTLGVVGEVHARQDGDA